MPIGRGLGATMLTAPNVYPGVSVSSDDCLAAICGWNGLTDAQSGVCANNGYSGNRAGCIDPTCVAVRSRLKCGTVAAAPAPSAPVVTGSNSAPAPAPASTPVGVTVETQAGPMVVSSSLVPGVADMSLTPVQVRIPNIWDLLDASKASQFEYRGDSRSLPVWISRQWRQANATPAPDGGAIARLDLAGVPWWVWLAVGGAAYVMGGRKQRRARVKK